MSGEWPVNSVVWGHLTTFPWWPGIVCDPKEASAAVLAHRPTEDEGPVRLVRWLGETTKSWIPDDKIEPFETPRASKYKANKTVEKAWKRIMADLHAFEEALAKGGSDGATAAMETADANPVNGADDGAAAMEVSGGGGDAASEEEEPAPKAKKPKRVKRKELSDSHECSAGGSCSGGGDDDVSEASGRAKKRVPKKKKRNANKATPKKASSKASKAKRRDNATAERAAIQKDPVLYKLLDIDPALAEAVLDVRDRAAIIIDKDADRDDAGVLAIISAMQPKHPAAVLASRFGARLAALAQSPVPEIAHAAQEQIARLTSYLQSALEEAPEALDLAEKLVAADLV
eukprot:a3031_53.p1 GENE.a3031_53~~a3031_53.p1  ORF type:complete len:356 (-),score=91.60 a3031_53:24-1058(-)